MADERDDIRARIDLVELVSQRVALKRAGKHWKGLCPFHDDKNPSFSVSPDIGYYRCWSCGEKGDIFDWVMKTQNLTFREALEQLAAQAGVTLKPRTGEASKSESDERAAAMADALRFFRDSLLASANAQDYCRRRGLGDEVQETWEIGYAPDIGEALAIHLQKKRHSLQLCRELFLVDQDAGGGFYDRFRGRLMFPIRDERGQLVAFGGRLLGDGHPKYVNSGDTPLFRKSRVLYGLNRAKTKLLETRRAVLVEGYLDVIACHRAGVEEAVASLGTAFAEDHARLLKRWCDRATILYDGDEAGQKAAERACEILHAANVQADVALSPPGDDPDTMLAREGPLAVLRMASGGISPLEFKLRRIELRANPGEGAFWTEAIAALAACDSPTELDRHVTELAARHMKAQPESVARITLYSRIKDFRRAQRRTKDGVRAVVAVAPMSLEMNPSEASVFRAFLAPDLRRPALEAIREPGLLWTESACALAGAIAAAFPNEPPSGPAKEWLSKIEDDRRRSDLADIEFFSGFQVAGKQVEDAVTGEALQEAIRKLRRLREEREIGEFRTGEMTDEKLAAIVDRLKALRSDGA